jgi:hypothetical protein
LGQWEVQPQFQDAGQTSQALLGRIYLAGIDVLPQLKDHKNRFLGNDTFDKKVGVETIFFYASAVSFVKIGKESEQVLAFNDGKFPLVILEPFQFMSLVEFKFSG